jgi:carbon storage regulator
MLARKLNESIVIGEDIVITIVHVSRGRVQLGVEAPGYLPVYRKEIVDRMVERGEIEPLPVLQPAAT